MEKLGYEQASLFFKGLPIYKKNFKYTNINTNHSLG